MQRVGAVLVSGATILALLCIAVASLWSAPVGAQAAQDPLADQTAEIAADSIGPIAVAGCEAAAGETASITVADADGTEQTFTDGAGGVVFRFGAQGITIAAQGGGDLNPAQGFDVGTGSVAGSEGITCAAAAGSRANDGQQQGGACANAEEVASVGPTTDNSVTPFETTGRTFRVSYTVSGIDPRDADTVEIDIEDRFGLVDFAIVDEDGSDSFIVTEQAGSFELVVNVRPQNSAEYTVTVEDCGGTGDGPAGDQYDDGDVDDPDDVVGGPKDDKPLPKTGGAPVLLGAAALALASALLARRILAP